MRPVSPLLPLFSLFWIFFLSNFLQASESHQKEQRIFFHCYSQFTRKHPGPSAPLAKLVKAGLLTGAQACLKLLKEVSFSKSGKINKSTTHYLRETEALSILKTFQDFHQNWFEQYELSRNHLDWPNYEIYDSGEMGFFITRVLFSPDIPFNSILQGKTSLEAIRHSKKNPEFFLAAYNARFDHGKMTYGPKLSWNPKTVNKGTLIGIKDIPPRRDILKIASLDKENDSNFQKIDLDIHTSFGGGLLGSPLYLLLNWNRERGEKSDGGHYLPRRYGRAIFKDLLCRDLPVLNVEDVGQWVEPQSSLSFRKSDRCQQCHVSMDQLSTIARQGQTVHSTLEIDPKGNVEYFLTRHLYFNPIDENLPVFSPHTSKDEFFFKRPGKSLFYMRDWKGRLIQKEVKDFEELGAHLLEMDDLYICMASRYFSFLTGIDTHFSKIIDQSSWSDCPQCSFIADLGLDFKKNKNLKILIEKILQSFFYEDGVF